MENKISRRSFMAKGLAGLVGFGLVREVLANELVLDINSNLNNSECKIVHNNVIGDKVYNFGPAPVIDCYVCTNEQALGRDGEPANSLETKIVYITGRNLIEPTLTDVSDDIRTDILGQENMVNKKITMKLYERIDNGSGGFNYAQIGAYSGWNMHESGQPIQLTVKNGINHTDGQFYPSHKLQVEFRENSDGKADYDFNDDGKRDLQDFAEISKSWLKSGNYLADTTGPSGTSDGIVGIEDLTAFIDNWLQ